MKKYKYKTVSRTNIILDFELDSYGEIGWQLVAICKSNDNNFIYTFIKEII